MLIIVIETDLPDGDDLRMESQVLQSGQVAVAHFGDVVRMNTDDGVHLGIFFGDGNDLAAGGEIGAHIDDRRDVRVARPAQHFVGLTFEVLEMDVGVRVDQHDQTALSITTSSTLSWGL
jgi:hypothetical protein